MKKQEQILAKSIKPIEIGDVVNIKIPYQQIESVTTGRGKSKVTSEVTKDCVFETQGKVAHITNTLYKVDLSNVSVPIQLNLQSVYNNYTKFVFISQEFLSHTYGECGNDPFKNEKIDVDFYNQDISSLLFKGNFGKRNNDFKEVKYDIHNGNPETDLVGKTFGGINFNPYIIDSNGNKQYYQRDFVWTLEQNQLLIESIYNGIEIGKFLFRYNSWNKMVSGMRENGHGYSFDCVDGKQRYNAIISFIQGKFPDSYGNYWDDLSVAAQSKFLNYRNLSYGQMRENSKDSEVVDTFLTLNFTGTPMSQEHIEYIKSIKM